MIPNFPPNFGRYMSTSRSTGRVAPNVKAAITNLVNQWENTMTSEVQVAVSDVELFDTTLRRQVTLFTHEVDRLNFEKINSLEHLEAQAMDIVNNIRRRREYYQNISREQARLEDLSESYEPRKKRDMTALLNAAHAPDDDTHAQATAEEESE